MFSVYKHKYKRLLSALLAFGIFTVQAATGVYADNLTVSYDSTTGAATSSYQNVTVEFEKAETYNVTLPKSVTLDVADETARMSYGVSATGEISTAHFVRVIPMSGTKVYNEDGTVALDLDVTLNKRRWNNTDVLAGSGTNNTSGVMTVDDIAPGKWTGVLRFLVTLDDGGAWTPATCTTPAKCTGYDTDDNGVIDADEQLATPITKGKSLGHKFADGSSAFPDTCERCKKMVYAISTPAQLTAFRDAVNTGTTFAGATVELNANIDMSGTPWTTGIGATFATCFKGTFDGNGYNISNLKITNTSNSTASTVGCGFFNYMNSTGAIRNFALTDCSVDFTYTGSHRCGVGAVVGVVYGANQSIVNVHVRSTNVKASTQSTTNDLGAAIFAGCVDDDNTTITNCSATGCSIYATGVSDSEVYTGGAAGYCRRVCTIKNSLFAVNSTIGTAKYYATGVAVSGYYTGSTTITNCVIDTSSNNDVRKLGTSSNYVPPVYSNCLRSTTVDCQSQDAVDILNTDNTKTWVLDLENANNGYPLIR